MDLLGSRVKPFTCNRVVGKPNPVEYDGESFADLVRTGADGGREYLVVSQCAHVCQRMVRFGDWLYIRTYHDGYHLTEAEELFHLPTAPMRSATWPKSTWRSAGTARGTWSAGWRRTWCAPLTRTLWTPCGP